MSALTGPTGRLRTVLVAAATAAVVLVLVAALLVTRLAGGSDGADDLADGSGGPAAPGWGDEYGVAASSDEEVATALAGGPPPTAASDFPRLPARCTGTDGEIATAPCRILDFGTERPTVVLWGDSHAEMYLPALVSAARSARVNVTGLIAGGCPPALTVRVPGQPLGGGCEQHNARAMIYLRNLQQRDADFRVVLNAFWSGYRLAYDRASDDVGTSAFSDYTRRILGLVHDGTRPLFEALGEMGISPDVLGQAATVMPVMAPCDAGQEPYLCDIPRDEALYDEADQRAWVSDLMALAPGGRYIDPSTAYCDEQVCHSEVDGVPTFWDDLHLGKQRTSTMAAYFAPTVESLVGG